ERNDGHFGGAAADVDHHGAAGVGYGQPCAYGCSHGLFDKVDLTGPRPKRRFADGAALDLGGATRNANDDARAGGEHAARMHHADELLEHLLGNGKVGDHAVFHGADGLDVAGHATQHLLGFAADRLDDFLAAGSAIVANCNDRRLIKHNTLAMHVIQCVGCTEVDRHIAGEVTTKESEHGRSVI